MRWPWVSRAALRLVERDLQEAHRRANAAENQSLRAIEQRDSEHARATQWRRTCLHERTTLRRHEGEIVALRTRAESAEGAYRGLVEKMLTPTSAPPTHAPLDADAAGLAAISDETVENMARQFVRDGMSPETAKAHAVELVQQAERAWGAVDAA